MTHFLISFVGGTMDHIPDEEMPNVDRAAHAVVQEILDAGAFVFAGGLDSEWASTVSADGTVAGGTVAGGTVAGGKVAGGRYPEAKDVIGGITIVDVASREEALRWAAKIAAACRCAQQVREVLPDPQIMTMLRQAAGRQ